MPFGKHQGEALSDVPSDYLEWLITIDLREPLRSAVHAEIDRRDDDQEPTTTSLFRPCPAPEIAVELVGAGLRSLARTYHPDAGGTNAAMQDVNLVVEWLRSLIGERN